jgi:hypothetical protein
MITGFYFSASTASGSDTVESELYVTDGGTGRRFIAPLSGISGSSGLYSGLNSVPVPVPALRDKFTHLCWAHRTGILNTSASPWLFGFFAPND